MERSLGPHSLACYTYKRINNNNNNYLSTDIAMRNLLWYPLTTEKSLHLQTNHNQKKHTVAETFFRTPTCYRESSRNNYN